MRALDLFFAARPMLHLPVWTVYFISLNNHLVRTGDSASWYDLAIVIALNLAFAAAFYINQYFDLESDRINKKLGFLQRNFLSSEQIITAFLISSLLAMALSSFRGWTGLGVLAQIVLLAWIYSAPPARLKDRPIWSLVSNIWAHGFLVSLVASDDKLVSVFNFSELADPLFFSLSVGAISLMTMIPDREGDAATGKRTLPVVLGVRPSLALALVFMCGAAYVAYLSANPLLLYLAAFSGGMILAALVTGSERLILAAIKLPLLLMTLLAGFYCPAYLLFVVALVISTRIYYKKRFGLIYPALA